MARAVYGVFLNIHPSGKDKRITIHKMPCRHYKQHRRTGNADDVYTFHKNCATFDDAVRRASEWALDWHAQIKVCKDCRRNWGLI